MWVEFAWWFCVSARSAATPPPVWDIICCTGDTSTVVGAKGPLTIGAATTGWASETHRPVRTSAAACARTVSVIRFSVPSSSSRPTGPSCPAVRLGLKYSRASLTLACPVDRGAEGGGGGARPVGAGFGRLCPGAGRAGRAAVGHTVRTGGGDGGAAGSRRRTRRCRWGVIPCGVGGRRPVAPRRLAPRVATRRMPHRAGPTPYGTDPSSTSRSRRRPSFLPPASSPHPRSDPARSLAARRRVHEREKCHLAEGCRLGRESPAEPGTRPVPCRARHSRQ